MAIKDITIGRLYKEDQTEESVPQSEIPTETVDETEEVVQEEPDKKEPGKKTKK